MISIGKKEIVVNIGYKSEGVIGASEFRYNPELKAGDKVPVFIEKQEDANGQLVVSHKTARIYDAWDKVNKAKEEDMIIQGSVKCRTKGGLIVDVFGWKRSTVLRWTSSPSATSTSTSASKWNSRLSKSTRSSRTWWCRTRPSLRPSSKSKRLIIQGLEVGQVLEGTVKNITSYGVFVDLEASTVWCTSPT